MNNVDYKKLRELREIVYDHATPIGTRMAAHAKYQAGLDTASTEFADHLEAIKEELNESGNAC